MRDLFISLAADVHPAGCPFFAVRGGDVDEFPQVVLERTYLVFHIASATPDRSAGETISRSQGT